MLRNVLYIYYSPHYYTSARTSETITTNKCLQCSNNSSLFQFIPPVSSTDLGIQPYTFMNETYFIQCTQAGHRDDVKGILRGVSVCARVCARGCVEQVCMCVCLNAGRYAIMVFKLCWNIKQSLIFLNAI